MAIETISPNWPLKKVKAYCTNRFGGVSSNDYFSLNLAAHVNDDPQAVASNRERLVTELALPEAPLWVQQISGASVLELPVDQQLYQRFLSLQQQDISKLSNSVLKHQQDLNKVFEVDALYTREKNKVCAILTADCIPLLLANEDEDQVAAVHAGWRGVVSGVVENSVFTFKDYAQNRGADLYAWIGPAIGPESFIVGNDVFLEFTKKDRDFTTCFSPYPEEEYKWLCDLPKIVSIILRKLGMKEENIYFSNIDTVKDDSYFSYRRDKVTGRFATLIYIPE